MKNFGVIIFTYLFLSGCYSGISSSSSYSSTSKDSPNSKCISYGHTEGTEAYATCVGNETRAAEARELERSIASSQARAARKRARDRMVWDDDWQ